MLPCRVPGTGTTGWVVAVSLLAPFAVIELGEVVVFKDGSTTEAEIEPYRETASGQPIKLEEDFQKSGVFGHINFGHINLDTVSLPVRISGILEKYGIAVLPQRNGGSRRPGCAPERTPSSESRAR